MNFCSLSIILWEQVSNYVRGKRLMGLLETCARSISNHFDVGAPYCIMDHSQQIVEVIFNFCCFAMSFTELADNLLMTLFAQLLPISLIPIMVAATYDN